MRDTRYIAVPIYLKDGQGPVDIGQADDVEYEVWDMYSGMTLVEVCKTMADAAETARILNADHK